WLWAQSFSAWDLPQQRLWTSISGPAAHSAISCHLQKRLVIHCLCRHHRSPERHPNTCTAPRVLPEVSSYLEFYPTHSRKYLHLILFSPTAANCSLHTPLPICSIPVLSYFLPAELSLFTKDKVLWCVRLKLMRACSSAFS
uniref:Uncharacterized protein n=1 Tax=Geospiza parvula TaxID=87175 RepID=A0A8C3MVK6_GEOPR